jgi:transglutaminase-like putative cysteine protease
MRFRTQLASGLHRLMEDAGCSFSARPHTYEVTCTSVVRCEAGEGSCRVLLPVPLRTPQQSLIDNITFAERTIHERDCVIATPMSFVPEIRGEEEFGNNYVVRDLQCTPAVRHEYTMTFTVRIQPTRAYRDNDGDVSRYTKLRPHLSWRDPDIRELAQVLSSNTRDARSTVNRLNRGVIERLQYGNPIHGLYSAREALTQRTVDCGGYDSLLASLAMACNIPARIVSGFWIDSGNNDMHAWLELRLPDGRWIPADPSVESLRKEGRTRRSGRAGFLGSDRLILSRGCDMVVEGERIAIMQHPVVFASPRTSNVIAHAETRVTSRIV